LQVFDKEFYSDHRWNFELLFLWKIDFTMTRKNNQIISWS
jgi:hypothetical protein